MSLCLRNNMHIDKKAGAIIILVIVIAGLAGYIGYDKYQESQEQIYLEGLQYGQLLEQRNAIIQIQSQGFYTIQYIDEENQTREIRLILSS